MSGSGLTGWRRNGREERGGKDPAFSFYGSGCVGGITGTEWRDSCLNVGPGERDAFADPPRASFADCLSSLLTTVVAVQPRR